MSVWMKENKIIFSVEQHLCICIPCETDAEYVHRIGCTSDGLWSVLCFLNSLYLDHSNTLIHSEVAHGQNPNFRALEPCVFKVVNETKYLLSFYAVVYYMTICS